MPPSTFNTANTLTSTMPTTTFNATNTFTTPQTSTMPFCCLHGYGTNHDEYRYYC